MNDIPVDHDYVKELEVAGMPAEQAEVIARRQANLVNTQLATKRDLADVRRDIADLKRDLMLGIGGMLGIAIAANTVIQKLFP